MPATGWGLAALAAAGLGLGVCRAAFAQASPSPTGPMTFDEVLRGERKVGLARFSPDGRQVLVSLERQDRPSGGAPWKLNATETFVWEVATGRQRRVGSGPFAPTLCEPWSPSGRRVAGLVLKAGSRQVAVWDRRTGRIVRFATETATQCPAWAGEQLLIPVTSPTVPSAGSSGLLNARALLARWGAAGETDQPQVTVHSSNPAFPNPAAADGAVMLADPASGRVRPLAAGAYHSITPAPGGRLVAMVRLGATDTAALSKRTGRLGEVEVFRLAASGAERIYRLPGFDVDYAALAWSRDGAELLVGGRDLADGTRGLRVVNPTMGTARRLVVPPKALLGEGARGSFSTMRQVGWIGRHPAFIAAVPGAAIAASDTQRDNGEGQGKAFRLFAEADGQIRSLTDFAGQSVMAFATTIDGEALVAADGALWGLLPTGARRRISAPDIEVVGLAPARPSFGMAAAFPRTPGRVAVIARDGVGSARRMVLDAASGRPVLTSEEAGVLATSPQLDAMLREDATGWSHRVTLVGRDATTLATFGEPWRRRAVGDIRPLTYVAAGRTLTGWIVLPPGPPTKPLPALVWVYGGEVLSGGPPADSRPGGAVTPVFSGQLWAAQGYAVIYPSTPVGAAAQTDIAATLADEVVAAVDAAARDGLVDPARVGLIGHSFGGFSVAAILAERPDRFRAGVAMSGSYDFITAWGARQPLESLVDQDGYAFAEETRGYVEQGQIGLGAPPFVDPAAYLRASPFFAAPRITTPLLLTVGDQDQGATSLTQAERMYAALRRTGNPAALVRYWGQGHVQQDPWAVRDQWARFTAWFDHYLKPAARSAPGSRAEPPAAASATRWPGRGPVPASSGPTTPSSPRD